MKRILSVFALSWLLCFVSTPSEAATNQLTITGSTPITAGAELTTYNWDIEDGMAKIAVIKVDLTNPHVQLALIPGEGKLTQRITVSKMASRTGALAAINGDFYNTKAEGAPIGTAIIDGKLASSQSKLEGVYCVGITKDRVAYIEPFGFTGKAVAANGNEYALSGVNKTVYWEEPHGVHSHIDKLHLYTDLWGGTTRGYDEYVGKAAEVLIRNNEVIATNFEGGFGTAVPEGYILLHGDGQAAEYLKANYRVGDRVQVDYQVTPQRDWSLVIGGHALLVNNGQAVEYTKDLSSLKGIRARTAIGISGNGKTLYLIAVEGRTNESKGLTLGNLSLFMTKLGIWKGVNLDGGGSTTMVSRPLGKEAAEKVLTVESYAAERRVVEALGIFSTAPQGQIKDINLSGSKYLLVGEIAHYAIEAYDEYYNTVTDKNRIKMTESNGLGLLTDGIFLAQKSGLTEIVAQGDKKTVRIPVQIIGEKEIAKIEIMVNQQAEFTPGSSHQLTVVATLNDGTQKIVGSNALTFTADGFEASVSNDGVLTIGDLAENERYGSLIASYGGMTTLLGLRFSAANVVELQIDRNSMIKDGQEVAIDTAPLIKDNRTMVPIRFVSEALGGEVIWVDDGNDYQIAYVIYKENLLELPINEKMIYVNGEGKALDVPSQVIQDRTMVPLRAIVEGLGMTVEYKDKTREIIIEG